MPCLCRLPVDGPNGSAVYAEASVAGRKKDAVHECANEACKMLDAYGLLRQSSHGKPGSLINLGNNNVITELFAGLF